MSSTSSLRVLSPLLLFWLLQNISSNHAFLWRGTATTRRLTFSHRQQQQQQQPPSPSSSLSLSRQRRRQRQRQRHLLLLLNAASASATGGGGGGNDETRGAALLVQGVNVHRGPSHILKDIDWRVEPRTKWALVGENGAGKSTLLKAIVGLIPHDGNVYHCSSRTTTHKEENALGYLQQTAVAGSNRTIYEEASSGMHAINQARQAMEQAENKGDFVALERATSRFEALGGYQQDQKIASVLKGLGFTDGNSGNNNFDRPCNELSGGWQMRVSFAKVLLSEPKLCLLDEPSNHLDSAAKKWLANYLKTYQGEGSMILVTHDVELLQSMDHIAELVPARGGSGDDEGARLQIYKSCTYEQYLQLKQERAAAAVAAYERNMAKAAKLQTFVDRFGASATKASAAQSRVKQIERMKRDGLLDDAAPTMMMKAAKQFQPSLVLPEPPKAIGESLLWLKDASVGYHDISLSEGGAPPLVTGINLNIRRGMKILVRGPNGSGKSTILHALRGSLPLLSGQRVENDSLRLGVFTQDLAQELDPEQRAVDIVTGHAREGPHGNVFVSDQEARGALGRLGLQGEKSLRRLKDLSGGEKARVALAMFSLKPSNLYLLDEASNHLDAMVSKELSDCLSKWGDDRGAMVVISHDKSFCERIEFNFVATVQDGTFKLEARAPRESDWHIDSLSSEADQQQPETTTTTAAAEAEVFGMDPKLRKRAYNAPKRIAKLEQLISHAEEEMAQLDHDMMYKADNDVGKLMDMTQQRDALEAKIDEYMEEWEELEALVSEAHAQAH